MLVVVLLTQCRVSSLTVALGARGVGVGLSMEVVWSKYGGGVV